MRMRLIDADALEIKAETGTDPANPIADMTFIRLCEVEDAPTIDAKPVEHAYWVGLDEDARGFASEYGCSNCDSVTYLYMYQRSCDYEFCPYCGARMDGDENAER